MVHDWHAMRHCAALVEQLRVRFKEVGDVARLGQHRHPNSLALLGRRNHHFLPTRVFVKASFAALSPHRDDFVHPNSVAFSMSHSKRSDCFVGDTTNDRPWGRDASTINSSASHALSFCPRRPKRPTPLSRGHPPTELEHPASCEAHDSRGALLPQRARSNLGQGQVDGMCAWRKGNWPKRHMLSSVTPSGAPQHEGHLPSFSSVAAPSNCPKLVANRVASSWAALSYAATSAHVLHIPNVRRDAAARGGDLHVEHRMGLGGHLVQFSVQRGGNHGPVWDKSSRCLCRSLRLSFRIDKPHANAMGGHAFSQHLGIRCGSRGKNGAPKHAEKVV